jgi:hypothetical protein
VAKIVAARKFSGHDPAEAKKPKRKAKEAVGPGQDEPGVVSHFRARAYTLDLDRCHV